MIFNKYEALGTGGPRSIGYYKMEQSTIQHNLNYCEFRPLQVLCEEFNKLTNTLKEMKISLLIPILGKQKMMREEI